MKKKEIEKSVNFFKTKTFQNKKQAETKPNLKTG